MNMRSGLRHLRQGLAFALLCSCYCLAGSDKQWPVKYLAGSKTSKLGSKLQLIITNELVSGKKSKDVVLQIPVRSITEVAYDTSSHNRGWTWLKTGAGASAHGSCSGSSEYCGAAEAVLIAPVLVGAAALSPFTSAQHFVRLLWEDNGIPSEALLEVGKDDYRPLLTDLQRVTGKPWQDLPQLRKKLASEIEQAKNQSQIVQLERDVVLNESRMKAGSYQAVLLERTDHHGEVYFFSGPVNPSHVLGQAVVQIKTPGPESTNTQVSYMAQQGVETIESLRFGDKELAFVSGGLPTRVTTSVRSFYGGGSKWATVITTDYRGETALRFHVMHSVFPHVCQEYLYVTHTRVASEIGANSPQSSCGTFSSSRSEVKAIAQEGKWTNRFLKVTADGKDYSFQPIFEEGDGNGRMAMLGKTRDAARDYSAFFVQAVTDFDSVVPENNDEKPKP